MGLKLLTALYLGQNQISVISKNAFDLLKNLTYLNLDDNRLKLLDFRWFQNLQSLISLHLKQNRIEKVKSWMHPWPSSLKRVDPSNNKIPIILPIPKHAEMFNLGGNPTLCVCRPKMFTLHDIPNLTLCKIKMQCDFINLKFDCRNKQLSDEVYKFWKGIPSKPLCQAADIKELAVVKNHVELPYITCIATGVPAPNVTLYSSDTEQKVKVYGAKKTNFTSVTMNKFFTGIYHCNASKNVDRMTRSLVVNTSELKVSDYSESSHSNFNWTSEVPVPYLKTEPHTEHLNKKQ